MIWTSNCEWDENTQYLVQKANSRIYFLRRLKALGASIQTLKEVYTLFVRSILEYCAPLWAGNLSVKSVRALSRVEKNALKVILPNQSYEQAISSLKIQNLSERRLILTTKCAQKMADHEKFKGYFKEKLSCNTRIKSLYIVPACVKV